MYAAPYSYLDAIVILVSYDILNYDRRSTPTRLAQDFSEQVRNRPFNNNRQAECHDSEHILPRFDSDNAVKAWFIIDFNVKCSLSKEEVLALPHEVYLASRQGDSW